MFIVQSCHGGGLASSGRDGRLSDSGHSEGGAQHHAHGAGRCEALQVIVRRTLADPVDPVARTALVAVASDVANTLVNTLSPTLGHIARSGIHDGPNWEPAEMLLQRLGVDAAVLECGQAEPAAPDRCRCQPSSGPRERRRTAGRLGRHHRCRPGVRSRKLARGGPGSRTAAVLGPACLRSLDAVVALPPGACMLGRRAGVASSGGLKPRRTAARWLRPRAAPVRRRAVRVPSCPPAGDAAAARCRRVRPPASAPGCWPWR